MIPVTSVPSGPFMRITHIVVASLPYGLLVRVGSNSEKTNMRTCVNGCKCNKDNSNVNSFAIAVGRSKEEVVHHAASVKSEAD